MYFCYFLFISKTSLKIRINLFVENKCDIEFIDALNKFDLLLLINYYFNFNFNIIYTNILINFY